MQMFGRQHHELELRIGWILKFRMCLSAKDDDSSGGVGIFGCIPALISFKRTLQQTEHAWAHDSTA